MRDIIVGIGDIQVSKDPKSRLKTFALGSCIAITMYNKEKGTGGMVHIALSNSKVNIEKSRSKPGYFADTALPEMIKKLKKIDSEFDPSQYTTKLTGGASVLNDENFFNIGKNNIEAAKRLIRETGFSLTAADVGGTISRTVTLSMDTGTVEISNAEKGKWEI